MLDFFVKYRTILIDDFKLTPESFESEYNETILKRGDSNQTKRDFIWRCFNELLGIYAKAIKDEEEMYKKQKEINMKMWDFLKDEGRDIRTVRKQSNNLDLLIFRARNEKSSYHVQVEIIAKNCCNHCDKIDGKTLDIKEAIDLQLLPYSQCIRNGGCICGYTEKTVRLPNGEISKKHI